MRAQAESCIWFADSSSIKQVNTDSNSVTAEVPLGAPRRLVMNDADCSVWVLRGANRRLIKFDAAGNQIRNVQLTQLDPGLADVLRIRLDPFDDSLWVTDTRRISHFDSNAGQLLAAFSAPADIRRFRIGMDQRLWVLGKRKLWRFSREGSLLEERLLDSVLNGEARHLAVDELRGAIWIAGDQQIARLDANGSGAPALVVQVAEGLTAFALDPITGRVWYGSSGILKALNPDGSLYTSVVLGDGEVPLVGPNRLAFDPASRSLWAGFEHTIIRLTDTGDTSAQLFASDYDDEAIGVPPFILKPRITLEHPPEEGIVNKPRPKIKLEYKARCNGSLCEVPDSYYASFQLTAALNGAAIGGQFEFHPDTRTATFNPASRLPEGLSSFSARTTDLFGHKSNAIDTTFAVDTIPPRFGTITPPEGTAVTVPQVTLAGSVNEARTSVVLENAQGLLPQGPNPQFPQAPGFGFSWGLLLQPGANPIQLSAIDAAGNSTTVVRTLSFIPPGIPQTTIQFPVNGAQIADGNVTVTGTWLGPLNTGIVVNGIAAVISGYQFAANVPLAIGANTITVTATGPDGQATTQSIAVTVSAPVPMRIVASAQSGLAPLQVNFSLSNTTTTTAVQITADFDGSGSSFVTLTPDQPFSHTYTTAGIYTATFAILDTSGATTTQRMTIAIQSSAQIDQQLQQVWSGFTSALAARDGTAARQYLNAQAQGKYGPMFNALQSSLPQIVASFTAPQLTDLSGTLGEYVIGRTINGVKQIFFIYFLRDADGVWRIDSM